MDKKDKILVVDDTPANIHVLGAMLQPFYDVRVAINGEMALETAFSDTPPDLVLLDIMMPDMDGYQICRALKSNEKTRQIPIIFVTAKNDDTDEAYGLEAGAVDFIKKPVSESIALARIKVHLELKKYRDSLETIALEKTKEATDSKELLKESEEEALKNMAYFKGLFVNSPHAIKIIGKNKQVIAVNKSFKELFGLSDEEIKRSENSFLTVPEECRKNHLNMIHNAMEGNTVSFETRRLHRNGHAIEVSALSYPVKFDSSIEGIFVIYDDISERKRFEEELRHQAFHDALTGIPNRVLFMDRLNHALERSRRFSDFRFAVMLLDLDKFKGVNDSLGHHAGDRLLVSISSKIQSCLRSVDTAARLGGDEFAILIENIKSESEVTAIAERINLQVAEPVQIDGKEIRTGASIGIVMDTGSYSRSQDIIRDADHAMYHAKDCGKSRYKIFNSSMHEKALKTIVLENELRKAITNHEISLYYQPIMSISTGLLEGFESLVRWNHPERGLISPGEFIPVAEESGLILPMGEQIIDMACSQLKKWKTEYPGIPDITMSINISAKQFLSSNFVEYLSGIVSKYELNASNINLELTETFLMEHSEHALNKLNNLRDKGFKLVIDDFGTGYSSLAYLRQFPIDNLKIDRSFISPLGIESQSLEIVKSILTLSESLGLNVVAEGVEEKDQFDILEKLSCQNAQGYFFSKPMPVKDASAFIERLHKIEKVDLLSQGSQ